MSVLVFFSNLEIIDYIIIALVVFILIFLFCLSSSLMKKNKELKDRLDKIENDKSMDNDIIKKEINLDKEDKDIIEVSDEGIVKDDINEILKDIPNLNEAKPYTKNVLKSFNVSGQTSPVNIGKSTVDAPKLRVSNNFSNSHLEKNVKYDEIEEISKRMEEEVKPQTIELTDYEKKQEEEAIISYQELIEAKNKTYNINDDEEIDSFIDELKNFRTDLRGE